MGSLTLEEMLTRIALTFLTSMVLGWERESHGRAAGLRTTILVGVAAAIAMMLSQELVQGAVTLGPNAYRPDPARLAAGILTGMGFLGAGNIIRNENVIRGVTTAAMIWTVSVLGLTFGAGQLLLGLAGWAVCLIVLFVLPYIENRVRHDWYAKLRIVSDLNGDEAALKKEIEQFGVRIKYVHLDYNLEKQARTMVCEIKVKKCDVFDVSRKVLKHLSTHQGIREIEWT